MTIIRKGVNKIGTAYSRKVNLQTITNDANGVILHAQIVPPYVWPGYMWAKWNVIDGSDDGVDSWKSAEANIFVQMVEIPDTTDDGGSYNTEAEVLTMANTYAPLDEVFLGTDSGSDHDVDITGTDNANVPDSFARTLCKKYHYKLEIGGSAYPTNADKIRYHFTGKYGGHLKTAKMVDISATKLIIIRGNTGIPEASATESTGMSGNLSPYDLYERLVENIPGRNDEAIGTMDDENLDANLDYWLNHGLTMDETTGDFFQAQALQAKLFVTTRFDIYEPAPRAMINTRG